MRRTALMFSAAAAAALLLLVGLSFLLPDSEGIPISEQSCRELVRTEREISDSIENDELIETSRAYEDLTELGRRVDRLGGCPGAS